MGARFCVRFVIIVFHFTSFKFIAISNYSSNALCLSSLILDKLIAKDGEHRMRAKKQINIEIGEQIRAAREQAYLTQEQLAEKIDVSVQFVSDLERGVVGISLTTLKKTCTVLGVTSDQILFGTSTSDQSSVFAMKCKGLSPKQIGLLMQIVNSFTEAVQSKQYDGK